VTRPWNVRRRVGPLANRQATFRIVVPRNECWRDLLVRKQSRILLLWMSVQLSFESFRSKSSGVARLERALVQGFWKWPSSYPWAPSCTAALHSLLLAVRDNYHRKSNKYVCITAYQPDTKSNPNPNPATKQHAIVNIQPNIVTCPTHPDKFMWDNVVAPSVCDQIAIVTLPVATLLPYIREVV